MILDFPPTSQRDGVRHQERVPVAAKNGQRFGAVAAHAAADYDEVMEQVAREPAPPPVPVARAVPLWQEQEFGFGDLLDVINPLHHIPIVATLYRNLTDDKIGFVPRVVGGALWGRIGGLVAGVVNSAVAWFTGKDVGDHVFAALWGERQPASEVPAAQIKVGLVDDRQQIAGARQLVEPEPAAVAPVPVPENSVELPAAPNIPAPVGASMAPLPGLNHWHDPLEIDAMVTGTRVRLRA